MQTKIEGIRIKSKSNSLHSGYEMDYDFTELVHPVLPVISDMFWVLHKVDFQYKAKDGSVFREYEENRDRLFCGEKDGCLLACRGFIGKYAKFIQGDWDIIVGIEDPAGFHGLCNLLSVNSLVRL